MLWSNANVSENFPEPVSPLLYSIASAGYYHYFRNLGRAFGVSRHRLALMDGPLRTIIGVHGARMYYNLTSIHATHTQVICARVRLPSETASAIGRAASTSTRRHAAITASATWVASRTPTTPSW